MISSEMLTAFVKVAETLSVSKSASALAIGKSVISKRIAQLESHLGATLFSRSTRKMALTSAGDAYLEHARKALRELYAGEEMLTALRSDLSGRIRVTSTVSWGQRVLCKKIPEFLRRHPGIELELMLSDRLMDLASERIDVAFRWSSGPVAKDLNARSVAHINWLLVCSPQYTALNAEPASPSELEKHSCLFYWRDPSDDWWVLSSGSEMTRVRVTSRYHVDNPDAVLEACQQGLGIALLPDYLCTQALQDESLVKVLHGWVPNTKFGTAITAVTPPDRMRVLRNKIFIDFVSEEGSA